VDVEIIDLTEVTKNKYKNISKTRGSPRLRFARGGRANQFASLEFDVFRSVFISGGEKPIVCAKVVKKLGFTVSVGVSCCSGSSVTIGRYADSADEFFSRTHAFIIRLYKSNDNYTNVAS